MFMLYYEASTKKVHAINGSGKAPAALTLERCLADLAKATAATPTGTAPDAPANRFDVPPHHPHAVTVPGAAAGWCDAVSRFGSGALTLSQLMEPAALLAEEGFPVSPITAHHWGLCAYQLETGPYKGGFSRRVFPLFFRWKLVYSDGSIVQEIKAVAFLKYYDAVSLTKTAT